jgi:hypothetical protein
MLEKVKGRAAGLLSALNPGSFFRAAAERFGNLVRRAVELVQGWGQKPWALLPVPVRENLPWLERWLGLALAGAALALLILLVVLFGAGRPAAEQPEAAAVKFAPIPPEDLFLPEEPDFLPPIILERERRDSWTADDAEPYWYNPLEQGEEEWRERVEQVIDDLLERIP